MVKSIFKVRRKQLKNKLKKTGYHLKAFGLGVETGRKIEQDLFKMSKSKLLEQKRLTTNKDDREQIKRVIDEKYPEKQDKMLIKKLR